MAERESPLGPAWKPGSHGNFADGTGVTLHETRPGSVVQVAAFAGGEKTATDAIRMATGLALPDSPGGGVVRDTASAFGFGPSRWLVLAQAEDLATRLREAFDRGAGTVTDLSHGRTVIRVEGTQAEWVLSKLFAIDFASSAFPVGAGRATMHHDIHVQIQRVSAHAFDLVVFRSFARSFWGMLCHAADEVGYVVK